MRTNPLSLAVALTLLVISRAQAEETYAFHHENVMGTSLELRVRADSHAAAASAEAQVLTAIDRLAKIFSSYDPSSELSRWQDGPKRPVPISPELFEVLQASEAWNRRSGGAFDVRAEALKRLWTRCAAEDRTPTDRELARARAAMRPDAWRLDPAGRTAERLSDSPISLDGIAKGYIVERACRQALDPRRGVNGLMLNVGGDLHVAGAMSQAVGVVDPRADSEASEPLASIEVRDRSVATSGRSQRGLMIGGRWYSHVFDPRTGQPVTRVSGATVIARSGARADALAKVFSVLAPEESLRLAESLPEVDCLIVIANGRTVRSAGWERYERRAVGNSRKTAGDCPDFAQSSEQNGTVSLPESRFAAVPTVALAAAPNSGWGEEFELDVRFEINNPTPDGGRYRRPYVAIWVENEAGFPVRNLTLWVSQGGPGPFQWLPELKRWYRSDQARRRVDKREMVFTISRPTRPPGKYSVVWDGKDDLGKPVPRGNYTLYIDAAREHGTYQSIRKPLELADQPFAEELKGNVEIKSASIAYRHRGSAPN